MNNSEKSFRLSIAVDEIYEQFEPIDDDSQAARAFKEAWAVLEAASVELMEHYENDPVDPVDPDETAQNIACDNRERAAAVRDTYSAY